MKLKKVVSKTEFDRDIKHWINILATLIRLTTLTTCVQ